MLAVDGRRRVVPTLDEGCATRKCNEGPLPDEEGQLESALLIAAIGLLVLRENKIKIYQLLSVLPNL